LNIRINRYNYYSVAEGVIGRIAVNAVYTGNPGKKYAHDQYG
jgi:hypothetical protein